MSDLIKCPKCEVALESIYDYTEVGEMEGKFELDCPVCSYQIKVTFEFVPEIKTA